MSTFNGLIAAPLDVSAVTAAEALNATTDIDNLFDDRPRRLVESTTADLTLDIDLGTATTFNLVAILFTNTASDSTWALYVADTQAGLDSASPLVAPLTGFWASASGSRMTRRHGFAHFSSQNKRWIRIALKGGAVDGGKLQVGRIVIAGALQPTWNYALGSGHGRKPLADENKSRTGQTSRRLWQKRRILSQRFPEVSEDEYYGQLEPIAEKTDEGPILIITEPSETASYRMEKMYYGTAVISASKVSAKEYGVTLTLTEWT